MEKQHIRPKHSGSKQLFENPLLEKLSRTHIAIPVSLFFLTGMVLLYFAFTYAVLDNVVILSLFLVGFFGFTFIEYWVHRSIYHIEPTTEARSKFQYIAHGVHHEYPKDKTRLAMPPVIAVLVVGLLFSISYFALNNYAFAFFPGFIWGYASYLLVHYCVHAYPPPKNFMKMLWVNHAVHHYKDGNSVFGVSSPIWDYVFGTMDTMDKNKVQENL
ncbi:fatty acid hydroxylase [Cytophagaceae bacterium 50C-KIRBA]|uniref:Fatty acid hydroxylase n=1 Tax=Aquirufa beregesia TaxID=2516556 RepID=A0ABX0EW91_9BACT|nr:sterol desaturase family protein [Aquirufa beregesia]NGZ44150.1 fatty acid hydroxylase [Aquirufa beregesia]